MKNTKNSSLFLLGSMATIGILLTISCKKTETDTTSPYIIDTANHGNVVLTNVSDPTPAYVQLAPEETQMLGFINEIRASGCQCGTEFMPPTTPLTWHDKLEKASYDYSELMYTSNVTITTLNHNVGGTTAGQRIEAAGYVWAAYAENIAMRIGGKFQVQEIFNAWKNSPGHCVNMMRPNVKELGVSHYFQNSKDYWTMELARRMQ